MRPLRGPFVRFALGAATLACASATAPAQDASTRLYNDAAGHFTAEVSLNNAGPFRFVVDTGSQNSVLVHKAAIALHLRPASSIRVTGASGAQVAGVVVVGDYRSNLFDRHDESMALMPDDLGIDTDGVLGMNLFADRRIEFDFEKGLLSVGASGTPHDGFVVQPGTLRLQSFLCVDVIVDGVHATAMIDTGGKQTIANPQLREALGLQADDARLVAEAAIHGVTTHTTPASHATFERLSIGGLVISRPSITFSDLPVFHALGLDRGPGMIIGIDQLSVLGGMAIDYPRAELQLRP